MKDNIIVKLEALFRTVDDDDLLAFCKEYAFDHQAFAKSLIEKFKPSSFNLAALKEEVWRLFEDAPGRSAKWGPLRDWRWIEDGLYRMILKARHLMTEGDLYSAASLAVEMLAAVGSWYEEDEVFSDEQFDAEDFCTGDAARLLIEILESGKLEKDSFDEIASSIRTASKLGAYKSYCILDMEELLFVADNAGLPPEEYISSLALKSEKESGRRKMWLLREASFMRARNMKQELDSLVNSNLDVTGLCDIAIDGLLSEGSYNEAVAFIKKAICCNDEDYFFVCNCQKHLLEAFRAIGDVNGMIEVLEQLFLEALSDIVEHYEQLKTLYHQTGQDERIKYIVAELVKKHHIFKQKEISWICAEQQMIPQLVECLRCDGYIYEDGLESLKQYSGLLNGKQREEIVASYINNLRADAVEVNSRNYSRIRYEMELLRDSCKEGANAVESLVSEFCVSYRRRPAFMSEMRRLISTAI